MRLDAGRRPVAHVASGPGGLERLIESEGVGLPGQAHAGGEEPNRFELL